MMKKTLTLLLALAPLTGFAEDNSLDASKLSTISRAERLSDVQLDQITAGQASTVLIMFNPGHQQILMDSDNRSNLLCINCLGSVTPPGETSRILIVNNPAKSFTKP